MRISVAILQLFDLYKKHGDVQLFVKSTPVGAEFPSLREEISLVAFCPPKGDAGDVAVNIEAP